MLIVDRTAYLPGRSSGSSSQIWLDLIWLDLIWLDLIWLDLIWLDLIWMDLIWMDLIWMDLIWIWLDLIWLDSRPLPSAQSLAAEVSVEDNLIAAEVLWTPEDSNDIMDRDDMFLNFPELVTI